MGRWNRNPEWRDFIRWGAVAAMAAYLLGGILFIFIGAGTAANVTAEEIGWWEARYVIKWLYRLFMIGNLGAVIWAVLALIRQRDGEEWPD